MFTPQKLETGTMMIMMVAMMRYLPSILFLGIQDVAFPLCGNNCCKTRTPSGFRLRACELRPELK